MTIQRRGTLEKDSLGTEKAGPLGLLFL